MSARRKGGTLRASAAVVAALALGPIASGCAGEERAETQPVPQANFFGEGTFGDIPVYPQSEALNEPDEQDGVTTQSFQTLRVTPEELMDWYETALAREGWEATMEAGPVGTTGYRGIWITDEWELTVSSAPGPEADGLAGRDRYTQFSLSVAPRQP